MIRTAIDSDDLSQFNPPTTFGLVYSDLVADPAAFERLHGGKEIHYIDRGLGDPGDKASIIDVENGAHSPASIAAWYDAKAHNHVAYLTYYCDRANIETVEHNLGGRRMFRWIATLDGTVHIAGFPPLAGPDLVQIANSTMLGLHADLSLVLNPGWHPSPSDPKLAQMATIAGDLSRDFTQASGQLSSLSAMIKAMQ